MMGYLISLTRRIHIKHCQKLHRERLRNMKPAIDNKPPKRHNHLRKNMKREQMMEERFAQIERENRLLLEKMSYIMQRNTLDNKSSALKYGQSLNKAFRKRELQRITQENQAILRRIQAREPNYNHLDWEESRRKNEQYLKNIVEYPLLDASRQAATRGGEGAQSMGQLPALDDEYQRQSRERMQSSMHHSMSQQSMGAPRRQGGMGLTPLN
jgi:E3 ubiquitin-protein ligase TRIP12